MFTIPFAYRRESPVSPPGGIALVEGSFFGGVVPVLSTAPGAVDIITCTSDGNYMYTLHQADFQVPA